jgi:CheY-like chemotaxis protein
MDVQMPVMDGYTATRLLRERGCHVPVLALTANAMKGFEREIEAAGFTGYLTKPVDIDAMLAELASHLDGRRVVAGEAHATSERRAAHSESWAASLGSESDVQPLPAGEPVISRLANHPRLQQVVRTFALQLPEKLQAMLDAQARFDLAELASLAHWLKGAGGTVGYDEFFEPARDLEQHTQSGDLEAIAEDLARLCALVQRIVIPDAAATQPSTAAAAAVA